jgi:lipopolysaccharide/colanic/teichoic acid biosynthesis glycosyltransferase
VIGWRFLQRLVAIAGLVILSPVLLVVAVAIRLGSRGPVIHRARRMGRGGSPIVVHKFRTMTDDAELVGPAVTGADDPRITRIGGWLRRRRVDELPQLWDVARGAMALVGPRPEAIEFVDLASSDWQTVLSVAPGITGSSQLRFHDEAAILRGADATATYRERILPEKLAADVAYVQGRSVRGDLAILGDTMRLLLGRR